MQPIDSLYLRARLTFGSIGNQIEKAARANPADSLRFFFGWQI